MNRELLLVLLCVMVGFATVYVLFRAERTDCASFVELYEATHTPHSPQSQPTRERYEQCKRGAK